MNLITAVRNEAHITPKQDSTWHRALSGVESCVFDFGSCFEPDIVSNNEVYIASGSGMLQGRYFEIDPNGGDTVTIANGAQGMKRIDLICACITQNPDGTQTGSWEVIQGTPDATSAAAPDVPVGDLDNGAEEAYYPVIQVNISGINIESVTRIASPEIEELIDAVTSLGWTDLIDDDSLSTTQASTQATNTTSNTTNLSHLDPMEIDTIDLADETADTEVVEETTEEETEEVSE